MGQRAYLKKKKKKSGRLSGLKKKKSKRIGLGRDTQIEMLKAGAPWSRGGPQLKYLQPDFDTDEALETNSHQPGV